LIPAEYIGEKKVAGRRDLRSAKAWLKSLTEHFGKKRLNQITFGDIKAYKLILIRRPVQAILQWCTQRGTAKFQREWGEWKAALDRGDQPRIGVLPDCAQLLGCQRQARPEPVQSGQWSAALLTRRFYHLLTLRWHFRHARQFVLTPHAWRASC
jgi:hypothetical protein